MTAKAQGLFLRFRDQATELRAELAAELSSTLPASAQAEATANLRIVRTAFGKWCIEILVVLFPSEGTRFNDLRRALPGITSDTLSRKLRGLEKIGLVEREVGAGRPPPVTYYLTEDGRTLARMGEPVLLFLRLRTPPVLSSHR
jgi:DNA-binding HxlR family transcriptional regulator